MESRHLTLREALAHDQLEQFVRQEETRGIELGRGSDIERALALLVTQRKGRSIRLGGNSRTSKPQRSMAAT
jgi:hypothetical protein